MNSPKRVYDEVLTNWPCELWLREIASEDFNDVQAITPLAIRPEQVPAATQSGRQVQFDAISQDDVKEVA